MSSMALIARAFVRRSTSISHGSLSAALGLQGLGAVDRSVPLRRTPRVAASAEEALEPYLRSDGMVFIHAGAATPQLLMEAMIKVAKQKKLRRGRREEDDE